MPNENEPVCNRKARTSTYYRGVGIVVGVILLAALSSKTLAPAGLPTVHANNSNAPSVHTHWFAGFSNVVR